MTVQKKHASRNPRHRAPARKPSRLTSSSQPSAADRRLEELAETLNIMMPELSARVAAIEHLLIEKRIGTRDDLIRSREFVDSRQTQQ